MNCEAQGWKRHVNIFPQVQFRKTDGLMNEHHVELLKQLLEISWREIKLRQNRFKDNKVTFFGVVISKLQSQPHRIFVGSVTKMCSSEAVDQPDSRRKIPQKLSRQACRRIIKIFNPRYTIYKQFFPIQQECTRSSQLKPKVFHKILKHLPNRRKKTILTD